MRIHGGTAIIIVSTIGAITTAAINVTLSSRSSHALERTRTGRDDAVSPGHTF